MTISATLPMIAGRTSPRDIRTAGLAVTKRAYAIYKRRNYEAAPDHRRLAGHASHDGAGRGRGHHVDLSHDPGDAALCRSAAGRTNQRARPEEVTERLSQIPDFVRAYEPDGMRATEFITYGVTQRTLSQFYESGWKLMENFRL